jgi:sulfite reductase (NADPH) flavoprotein alpha-component
MGLPLALSHVPVLPPTRKLILAERTLYGMEVQAPVVVLRFALPDAKHWFGARLPRFEVGDLVGIVPPGSDLPRYYSVASASRGGMLEICVRKQSGGICSEFLHALSPGDGISIFIRANPDFRPNRGRRPLILIGAGAGVAPLAGFVRHNRSHRPVHLFFGARDPASDFLYREDLEAALDDGRLASLNASFSRIIGGGYVQSKLLDEAESLRRLVRQGAQIMVCGGRDMADGVRQAIDVCLAPIGLSANGLKQQGLYLEDAY